MISKLYQKQVDLERLTKEINESPIKIKLDYINTSGNSVEVFFKGEVDADDELLLNDIVMNTVAEPLPVVNPPREVVTQSEKNDKVLKLAQSSAEFVNDEATVEIQIPGDPAAGDGRHVAGGYAFQDAYKFGDRCVAIQVIDKDDILGAGPDFIAKTYHDMDVDPANTGWFLYASHQGQGELEIDPIGGYGFIPAGLYLQLKFKKLSDSPATKVVADIWWAKTE